MTEKRKPGHKDQKAFFAALGRRIKELRKERGWSLNDMHAAHGYVSSQWQKFEKGGTVNVVSLLRLADVFGLTIVQLLDSLGQFPQKDPAEVAVDPSRPARRERTLKKPAAKKPAGKKSVSSK